MQPPTKRRRLETNALELSDDDDDELAYRPEEASEYKNPTTRFERRRHRANHKLQSAFETIFAKYGRDFDGIGDEVDMMTGEVLVNNGHLSKMRKRKDVLPDRYYAGGDDSEEEPSGDDNEDLGEDKDAEAKADDELRPPTRTLRGPKAWLLPGENMSTAGHPSLAAFQRTAARAVRNQAVATVRKALMRVPARSGSKLVDHDPELGDGSLHHQAQRRNTAVSKGHLKRPEVKWPQQNASPKRQLGSPPKTQSVISEEPKLDTAKREREVPLEVSKKRTKISAVIVKGSGRPETEVTPRRSSGRVLQNLHHSVMVTWTEVLNSGLLADEELAVLKAELDPHVDGQVVEDGTQALPMQDQDLVTTIEDTRQIEDDSGAKVTAKVNDPPKRRHRKRKYEEYRTKEDRLTEATGLNVLSDKVSPLPNKDGKMVIEKVNPIRINDVAKAPGKGNSTRRRKSRTIGADALEESLDRPRASTTVDVSENKDDKVTKRRIKAYVTRQRNPKASVTHGLHQLSDEEAPLQLSGLQRHMNSSSLVSHFEMAPGLTKRKTSFPCKTSQVHERGQDRTGPKPLSRADGPKPETEIVDASKPPSWEHYRVQEPLEDGMASVEPQASKIETDAGSQEEPSSKLNQDYIAKQLEHSMISNAQSKESRVEPTLPEPKNGAVEKLLANIASATTRMINVPALNGKPQQPCAEVPTEESEQPSAEVSTDKSAEASAKAPTNKSAEASAEALAEVPIEESKQPSAEILNEVSEQSLAEVSFKGLKQPLAMVSIDEAMNVLAQVSAESLAAVSAEVSTAEPSQKEALPDITPQEFPQSNALNNKDQAVQVELFGSKLQEEPVEVSAPPKSSDERVIPDSTQGEDYDPYDMPSDTEAELSVHAILRSSIPNSVSTIATPSSSQKRASKRATSARHDHQPPSQNTTQSEQQISSPHRIITTPSHNHKLVHLTPSKLRNISPLGPHTPRSRGKDTTRAPSSRRSILSILSDEEDAEVVGSASGRKKQHTSGIKSRNQAKQVYEMTPSKSRLQQVVVVTPGKTVRACGTDGFKCGRTFCFSCQANMETEMGA